jgi:uncharacterized protein (DUF2249 family)
VPLAAGDTLAEMLTKLRCKPDRWTPEFRRLINAYVFDGIEEGPFLWGLELASQRAGEDERQAILAQRLAEECPCCGSRVRP